MKVETGYRDLTKPFDDCNLSAQAGADGQTLSPVTRVIPNCGHTYFIRGHPADSPLITNLCTGCASQQTFQDAKRRWDETKWTQTGVEIRG